MRRSLVVWAAVAASLAQACGDDDDLSTSQVSWALPDGGVLGAKVTGVGAACSADAGCQGTAATCMTVSSSNTSYPGGYCTAECERAAECGPNAACPVGESLHVDPTFEPRAIWSRTCYRACTGQGPDGGCRLGYTCRSLADAYGLHGTVPAPMRQPVCIPIYSPKPTRRL